MFLVLRMWDVLLFEGNRVVLFRTAFAIMELYGIITDTFVCINKCVLIELALCLKETNFNYSLFP